MVKNQENWKLVDGFNGKYAVSDWGNIKNTKTNKLVTQGDNGYGYLYVFLGAKRMRVSRLVAEAFIPNPDNKYYVDHQDDNTYNNRADNLQWLTNAENVAKSKNKPAHRGKVVQLSKDGEYINTFKNSNSAAKELNLKDPKAIRMVCQGKMKSYKGYKWEYADKWINISTTSR